MGVDTGMSIGMGMGGKEGEVGSEEGDFLSLLEEGAPSGDTKRNVSQVL